MAAISITSVVVLDNPAPFTNPLQFEIQYECSYALEEDVEWKIIYVGSAEDEKYDQTLDSVLVGPMVPGQFRFVFQADAPDPKKLPQDDIVGVTVLLLTCSYRNQEFVRIGYYVNNDYLDEELRENPPADAIIDKLQRSILADKPRVTKFQVQWDKPLLPPTASEAEEMSMQAELAEQHEYSPIPPPSFGQDYQQPNGQEYQLNGQGYQPNGQEYQPNGIAIDMES